MVPFNPELGMGAHTLLSESCIKTESRETDMLFAVLTQLPFVV